MYREALLLLLHVISTVLLKEIDLPLCPTNIQYFPQNLPLHCKMPPNVKALKLTGQNAAESPPMLIGGSPSGQMMPVPFSGPMPAPGQFPGSIAIPAPFPGPIPMPIPASPQAKLPVIVMPIYSPDPSFKNPKKSKSRSSSRGTDTDRHLYSNTDTGTDINTDISSSTSDTSSSTSSERSFWRRKKRKRKGWKRDYKRGFERNGRRFNRQLKAKRRRHQKKVSLTPILQYVTKDGYVIFEKKISSGEAKDWLNDENITNNNILRGGVTQKQNRVSNKDNIINGNKQNVKSLKNNKNVHRTIIQLNDDKNMDYEDEDSRLDPPKNKIKNKEGGGDSSSEEDGKIKQATQKRKRDPVTKKSEGKPQRSRPKSNKS